MVRSDSPPSGEEDPGGPAAHSVPRVREVIFPKRGFSATESLIAVNLLVSALLFSIGGTGYAAMLRETTTAWWEAVDSRHAYGWWLATLFMHADPGHLLRNLLALLGASSAVEFLAGRRASWGVYLLSGLGGAWASFAGKYAPPLSVGASGAIFGLLGASVAFIVRRRGIFNYAQRWKVWRVYVPLFVLLFLPALANADVRAHAGGFATGLVAGIFLPPHGRVRELAAVDPLEDGATDSTAE
jgi:rhomboid protease GluP